MMAARKHPHCKPAIKAARNIRSTDPDTTRRPRFIRTVTASDSNICIDVSALLNAAAQAETAQRTLQVSISPTSVREARPVKFIRFSVWDSPPESVFFSFHETPGP